MRACRINLSGPGLHHVTPSMLPQVARLCFPWQNSIPLHVHIIFPGPVFLSLWLTCCIAVCLFLPIQWCLFSLVERSTLEAWMFMTLSSYYWTDVYIWWLCFFLWFILKLRLFLSNISNVAPACCWLSFVKNYLSLSICVSLPGEVSFLLATHH